MPFIEPKTFHDLAIATLVSRQETTESKIGTILTPNETQRNTLIAAGVYIIVIGILWCVSLLHVVCKLVRLTCRTGMFLT